MDAGEAVRETHSDRNGKHGEEQDDRADLAPARR
jgi:hypothetical protein